MWSPPVTTENGLTPTGYKAVWTRGSGVEEVDVLGLSSNLPGSLVSLGGTANVVVYAMYGTWLSPVSTQRLRVTTTLGLFGAIVNWTCTET